MGGKESHKAKLPVRELVFNQVMTESHTTSDFDELTQQRPRRLKQPRRLGEAKSGQLSRPYQSAQTNLLASPGSATPVREFGAPESLTLGSALDLRRKFHTSAISARNDACGKVRGRILSGERTTRFLLSIRGPELLPYDFVKIFRVDTAKIYHPLAYYKARRAGRRRIPGSATMIDREKTAQVAPRIESTVLRARGRRLSRLILDFSTPARALNGLQIQSNRATATEGIREIR